MVGHGWDIGVGEGFLFCVVTFVLCCYKGLTMVGVERDCSGLLY